MSQTKLLPEVGGYLLAEDLHHVLEPALQDEQFPVSVK
jgi:hypothetical protein